jgi:hypothetical protein
VKSVYLTCDSPGTYYYGGTSYRKSLTCKYGDSVNLSIFCEYEAVPICCYLILSVLFCFYFFWFSCFDCSPFKRRNKSR